MSKIYICLQRQPQGIGKLGTYLEWHFSRRTIFLKKVIILLFEGWGNCILLLYSALFSIESAMFTYIYIYILLSYCKIKIVQINTK